TISPPSGACRMTQPTPTRLLTTFGRWLVGGAWSATAVLIIVGSARILLDAQEAREALAAERAEVDPGPPPDLSMCGTAKCIRAPRVCQIRPHCCAHHGSASCQRSACPPDVQGGDVPVPDRLLAPG